MKRLLIFSASAVPLLVDASLKGAALLALAGLGVLMMARSSAAARHLVWLVAVLAVLALPVLSLILPGWRVLPAWAVPPAADAAPAPEKNGSYTPYESQRTYSPIPAPAVPRELPSLAAHPESSPGPPASPDTSVAVVSPAAAAVALPPPVPGWHPALPFLWSAGGAALLLRLIGAHWLLRRAARRARSVTDGPLAAALAAAASQLGVTQRVRLLVEEKRTIPVVWGVWRPRLLLPAEALTWDAGQLQSVLLHELAHIRRRDTLVQWVTQIACSLHWINPLVWLAAWRLHVERERACDDMVLASGVKPSAYAGHLLHVASQLSPARWTSACGLAMARKSALEGRLMAVLSGSRNRRRVTRLFMVSAAVLGGVVAIPVAILQAQSNAAREISTTPVPMPDRTGKLQPETLAKLKWGDPVNGLRMALAFPPALEDPLLGDEAFFQLVVQNVSTQEVRFTTGDEAPNPRSMQWGEGERMIQSLSDWDPQKAEWKLAPGECGVLWMFTKEERKKDGSTISADLDQDLAGGPRYHVICLMEVATAPAGAWTGKLTTGPTRGSGDVAAAPAPQQKDARALYEIWQRHARTSDDIPGALIGELAAAVKTFTGYNPTWETVPKLNAILPRLDATHDWKPADAIPLLDKMAAVQDSPLQTAAEKLTAATIRQGEPLPEKFASVAWGQTQPNGLRAAWVLEPGGAEHRLGEALKARLLVQNTGTIPVMVRVPTWHQGSVKAGHETSEAKSGEPEVSSTRWTTMARLIPVRLGPGEFIEINAPGVGLGKDAGRGPWAGPRVGSNVPAKDGTELTLTHGPLALDGSGVGMREDAPHLIGPGWWQAHIKARLACELPLPAGAAERIPMLDRAMRELFATAPTAEETAAFTADQTPGAFDALVQRLATRPDVLEFSGNLDPAPVKFRVIAADPAADKTPRVVLGPGEYPVGGDTPGRGRATLKITGRPVGDRRTNDAQLLFEATEATGKLPPDPHKLEIPDGWGTWAIVCRPGDTFFYLLHNGGVRKIDYSAPAKITDLPASDLPDAFRDEVKRQMDIAGVSAESLARVFEKPVPPADANQEDLGTATGKGAGQQPKAESPDILHSGVPGEPPLSPLVHSREASSLLDQIVSQLNQNDLLGARTALQQLAKLEPGNIFVKEWLAKYQERPGELPPPKEGKDAPKNLAFQAKIAGIRFPEITLQQATVEDALALLYEASLKLSPDNKGPGLIFAGAGTSDQPPPTVTLREQNVTLLDVLRSICRQTGYPLRIDADAVVVGAPLLLETRVFKLRPGLAKMSAGSQQWKINWQALGLPEVAGATQANLRDTDRLVVHNCRAHLDILDILNEQELLPKGAVVVILQLPDDQYVKSGLPVGDVKDVVWNDSQNGLSPGYRITGDEWRILGKPVEVELWVWNAGDEDVKLQINRRPDIGLRLKLKHGQSGEQESGFVPDDRPPFGEPCLLPPGHALKVKAFPISLLSPANDVSGTGGHFFSITPGAYGFQCGLEMPGFTATGEGGKQLTPAAGEWTGQLTTREVNITVVAPEAPALKTATVSPRAEAPPLNPMHESAQSLFRKWQAGARTDGKIPGGLIGHLAEQVDSYLQQYPKEENSPKLAAVRPKLDTSHDWTQAEAVGLLDEITAITTVPVSWTELPMEFDKARAVQGGQPLPVELDSAPWGQPAGNGLRAAWLLEPPAEQYAPGSVLKARVLFHNTGKAPVVFQTETWHQQDGHKALDGNGAEFPVKATWFTGITPMVTFRLAPGEYCEVKGHGIAIGAGEYQDGLSTAAIGAIIEAKEGDMVTLTHTVDAAPGGWTKPNDPKDPAELRKQIIARRVESEAPMPRAAADREQLIRRVTLDLSGTLPTPMEVAAFNADDTPDALARLTVRLQANSSDVPWTGKLPTGETKFRVIAADPDAAKAPRAAVAPGRYVLGDNVHLQATQITTADGKRTNKAQILFLSPDPKVASLHEPYDILLPDGSGTYAFAWVRGSGELWLLRKAENFLWRYPDFLEKQVVSLILRCFGIKCSQ